MKNIRKSGKVPNLDRFYHLLSFPFAMIFGATSNIVDLVFMFLAAMVALTESICWKIVKKTSIDGLGIGLVIYQKPVTSSCYEARKEDIPRLCDPNRRPNISWYDCYDSLMY